MPAALLRCGNDDVRPNGRESSVLPLSAPSSLDVEALRKLRVLDESGGGCEGDADAFGRGSRVGRSPEDVIGRVELAPLGEPPESLGVDALPPWLPLLLLLVALILPLGSFLLVLLVPPLGITQSSLFSPSESELSISSTPVFT